MKNFIIIINIIVLTNICSAQVSDTFSDGDFTNNPSWTGHVNHFTVNANQQLQLSNSVAATSYLSTSASAQTLEDYQWDILVKQNFAGSGSNYTRVYLVSSVSNLTQSLNGYFIQLGEVGSNDAIELFRQSGLTLTSVCRGTTGKIVSAFNLRLRVKRDTTGKWRILVDYSGGSNLIADAEGVDSTYNNSEYFGILCTYTATNANRISIDDIYAGIAPKDLTPPTIEEVNVINDHQIVIKYSESVDTASATTAANYAGERLPVSLKMSGYSQVELTYPTAFINGRDYSLTITGVKDLNGNVMTQSTKHYRYFVPDVPSRDDVVINEIFPDPAPVVGLPSGEFIEIFNRTNKTFDLAGWQLTDGSTTASFPAKVFGPGEYLIVTTTAAAADYQSFGATLGLTGFPSLNNSSDMIRLSANGASIDSLLYQLSWYDDSLKADGGYTLERLNPDLNSNQITNWRASVNSVGGTPGKVNSVFGMNPDNKPPLVAGLTTTKNRIVISFNEEIRMSDTFIVTTDYTGNIITSISESKKELNIDFNPDLTNGLTYILTMNGISDLAGNIMNEYKNSFSFFIPTASRTKDIIFTEIMSDPSPIVQLPEAEYIELYNRASGPLNLNQWALADDRSKVLLPNKIVLPGEYVVLTSTANALKFGRHALGVSGFPSLSNAGEHLTLTNELGLPIDSVFFDVSWYRNEEKSEGGWSLELIDTNNPCGEENNWVASENENGGTPGFENSVSANKPDLQGPKLIGAMIINQDSACFKFDERLNESFGDFSFTPAIVNSKLSYRNSRQREIVISGEAIFSPRTLYEVKLASIKDCSLNEAESIAIHLALPEPAKPVDIVLNEILFNPRPNGSDFVEICNRSNKYIDLKTLRLTKVDTSLSGNGPSVVKDHELLAPGQIVAFATDRQAVPNLYPLANTNSLYNSSLPSMPDDEGSIVLLNDSSVVIDQFVYSSKMHSSMVRDEEGVSLERVSIDLPTSDVNNWRSANSTSGFATPGYLNSNSRPSPDYVPGNVVIEPEVFSKSGPVDFARINYSFDEPGQVANVTVFDAEGRLIRDIAMNETCGYEGSFRWDGDRYDGKLASAGYYVVWFQVFDLNGAVRTYRKRVVLSP